MSFDAVISDVNNGDWSVIQSDLDHSASCAHVRHVCVGAVTWKAAHLKQRT